jgi:hypothetical protein
MEILGGSVRGRFADQGRVTHRLAEISGAARVPNFFFKNMGGKRWSRNKITFHFVIVALLDDISSH